MKSGKAQPKKPNTPELEKATGPVEETYRLLFEKNPHPMYVFDQKTWRFLAVNEAAINHYGYSREEFLAMNVFDIRPPQDVAVVREYITYGFSKSTTVHRAGVWRHCKKDGTIIEVEITASLIIFQGRQAVLVLAHDVTERLRSEGALRESEARFQALAKGSPAGIFRASLNWDCLYANEQASQITGLPVAELLGKGWVRTLHPEDRDRTYAQWLQAVKERRPFQAEYRNQTPNGQTKWIIGQATPELGPAGEPIAYVGTIIDITERKKAENLLRESEARFRTAFDFAPNGVAIVGLDGRFLRVNHLFCEMLGYSEAELLERRFPDITHPDDLAHSMAEFQRVLNGEITSWEFEKRYIHKSGRPVWVLLRGTVLSDAQGRLLYMIGHFQDFTLRKQAETEREQLFREAESARNQLQQLSRRLVQVQEAERRRIALELHDQVGQELTALKLGLEQCQDLLPAASRGLFEETRARAHRLLTMVRDLSLDLRPTMLDDLGLLDALLWYLDRFKAASGLRVEFKHRGLGHRRFPTEIETAAFRIVQEGLTNVTRHSQAKEVTVRLWASRDRLTLSIEDQGIGFAAEAVLRASTSTGLSGMRERVALLGGHFSIDSVAGRGTSLTAELPLQDKAGEQLSR